MDKYTCLVEVTVIADDKLKAAHLIEGIIDTAPSSLCDVRSVTVCAECLNIRFMPRMGENDW